MARTGKQTYTRDDCFGDGDMTEIEVDRPEKEVFDPKTLASFENVPITIEHPQNNVDSDNYSSLAVGYMRDIHKGMYQGQPVMLGTAVITDSEGIEKVESGELTNLSCGYDCDIEDDKNPKQTNIRGNHIALCEVPRAGITHIQDSISETRNPKKRAFLDSLVKNHISYVEKEPNRFTFLTDDIGKAKRLARQIVGNNFLEDKDILAIDFYKERNNKMKKDSQGQEIEEEDERMRRKFGRLWDKITDLQYGEFTIENPIGKTKFAGDHYWNFMFNKKHYDYFFNWFKRKYPRLYAEYMRKLDEDNDFEYGEDEDNALVSKEEWKEIMNKDLSDYPEWADSKDEKDTFIKDRRTRDNMETYSVDLYWEDERGARHKSSDDFSSIAEAKEYVEEEGHKTADESGKFVQYAIIASKHGYIPQIIEKDMIVPNRIKKDDTFFNDRTCDDIVKQGNGWANKGKEGTHGHFRTKKEAREQQKAMFARGYKADDSIVICADSYEEAVRKYKRRLRNRF